MPHDIAIRCARPDEAAALAELANALDLSQGGGGCVHSAGSILRDAFGDDPPVRLVVAMRGAEAIGYAMYSRFYNSDTAETGCYLNDLYVRPQWQRHGVGRLLVAAVARETLRRGGRCLWTGVYRRNVAGLAFYRSLGALDGDACILEIDRNALCALAG